MKIPGLQSFRRPPSFRPSLPRLLFAALLGASVLLAVACSDEIDPNATATPAPPATLPPDQRTPLPTPLPTNTPAPTPTRDPSGRGPVVLSLGVNGDAFEFSSTLLSAPAGSEVLLTFNNSSVINQHNWVLVENGTKDAVAADGATAGADNAWVPPDDGRVLVQSSLLDQGVTESIEFTAPAAGVYQFVCTFPGHAVTMFGEFIAN